MKKPKLKKLKSYSKSKKRKITVALIVVAIFISIGTLFAIGAFAITPRTGYATCTILDVGDDNEDVSDEAKVEGYVVNIADKTFKQVRNLEFDDYKDDFDEKSAEDVNTFIDENHLYYWKITYKSSVRWYRPEPGENIIRMVDKTESIDVYLEDEDTLNRTFYESLQRDWILRLALDHHEGLMPGRDFKEDAIRLVWFDFNFTRAAQESFAKIHDFYNEKKINGTHLYIGVSGMVIETGEYDLEFGSGKGDTFDCNNVDGAFGFYSTRDYMDS